MADGYLLKEILDSLHDVDSINLFAAANGLTGDDEVENRLKQVHIDNLWEELLLDLGPDFKKPRNSPDNDESSTSIQSGVRDEERKPYFIWKKDTRTFKNNLALAKVLNFNETIPVDEHLMVTVGSIDLLKGGSLSGNKLSATSLFGTNNSLRKKRSVLNFLLKMIIISVYPSPLALCSECYV